MMKAIGIGMQTQLSILAEQHHHKGLWMNQEVPFWLMVMRCFVVGCVEEQR